MTAETIHDPTTTPPASATPATPSNADSSESSTFEARPPIIRRALPGGICATWERVDPRLIRVIRDTAETSGLWPLTLYGPTGTGKSSLLALLAASWPTNRVRYYLASDLIALIQSARCRGGVLLPGAARTVSEDHLWRSRVDAADLLVLDDIGTRGPTDSAYDILHQIIDRRRRKPTALSTNLSPEELVDVLDDRIVSRLLAGTAVEMDSPDQRLQQGQRYRVSGPPPTATCSAASSLQPRPVHSAADAERERQAAVIAAERAERDRRNGIIEAEHGPTWDAMSSDERLALCEAVSHTLAAALLRYGPDDRRVRGPALIALLNGQALSSPSSVDADVTPRVRESQIAAMQAMDAAESEAEPSDEEEPA